MKALYYQNGYQTTFQARVESCTKGPHYWQTTLDQSCFYPKGGGQPGDRGQLGSMPVISTEKSPDGKILHFTKEEIRESQVDGVIDWPHRYTYMCQHSGQHIISAALHRMGHETLSVHLGSTDSSIDIATAHLDQDETAKLEQDCNEVIRKHLPIISYETSKATGLRRAPKKTGRVRVVEIEGWDKVGCGGVHVARTGEVLLIKVLGQERVNAKLRLHFAIADRALHDYQSRYLVSHRLTQRLSTPLSGLENAVAALQSRVAEHTQQMNAALQEAATY